MERRRLGLSGLRVSRLGLGTLTWGRDTDEDEAAALLSAFVDAGGTLVDTADVYADGDSERLLGRLLAGHIPREDVTLATKAGRISGDDSERDASRGYLLSALDGSLRRLGVEHVDLWQLHGWDTDTPREETFAAVDHAVTSGRVRYAGVSDYAGWQLARAGTWQLAWPGRTPLASTQVEYSLLRREVEHEVVPAARDLGVGLLGASPLGQGVLTGKYLHATPADSRGASPHFADSIDPYLTQRSGGIVESVVTAADGLGVSPLAVALSWVRDRPGMTAPIVGARTADQLDAALESERLTLPAEIRNALEDVSAP